MAQYRLELRMLESGNYRYRRSFPLGLAVAAALCGVGFLPLLSPTFSLQASQLLCWCHMLRTLMRFDHVGFGAKCGFGLEAENIFLNS